MARFCWLSFVLAPAALLGVAACSTPAGKNSAIEPGAESASALSGGPNDAGVDLDAIAQEIASRYESHRDLVCPGENIASTCGNFACEPLLGETKDNCPSDCRPHKVGAYNNLPICENVQSVAAPANTDEVKAVVRSAVASGRRVRVIGARHSASGVICGDGVALSTEHLANLDDIEIRNSVVYTPPGVKMKDLGTYLYDRGYSIGYTHLGFNGVTVAGAIGTSAHGSSPIHNNTVSHRISSLDVVGPDAAEHHYDRATTAPDIWRGLQTNLGLLGVITRVGLNLDPAFNLDTRIDFLAEDSLFDGEGALGLVRGCDWGQMNWFPGEHKVARWCGVQTTAPAEPNAHNVLLDPGVSSSLVPIAKGALYAGTCNADVACLLEKVRATTLEASPPIVRNDSAGKEVHVSRAVGRGADMTSAALIDLGKNVYFQMDWEVAVPQKYIQSALVLAREVFQKRHICLPGVGVFVRFGLIEDGGYFSYHSAGGDFVAGETAMFFETPVTVPSGYSPEQLDDYLGVYRDLIFTLIEQFGARAHWGKNLDSVFQKQVAVGTYAGRVEGFNQVVAALDPYGVFANDYGRQIGVRWPHDGEDFSRIYANDTCGCNVDAKPVCDRKARVDFATACRATCASKRSEDLLDGTCDRYSFVTLPLGIHAAYHDGSVVPASLWHE